MNAVAETEVGARVKLDSPTDQPPLVPRAAASAGSSLLISPSKVRRYLLDTAKKTRAHKFTRVSQETLDAAEAAVRSFCARHVAAAPSKGVTL